METDFIPGNKKNYEGYKQVYEKVIKHRRTYELEADYQNLVHRQGKYFSAIEDKQKRKENFYTGLKYLFGKASKKAFNEEVINQLKTVFEPDFHPDELLDDSVNEYREWKEQSKPFCLLAAYCEILNALDAKGKLHKIVRFDP